MKLCAKRSDKPCRLIFHNTTLHDSIQMIWIDYEGREHPFTILNPGEKCCQETASTHPFVMRLINNNNGDDNIEDVNKIVSIFVPNDETIDYMEVQPGMFCYDKEKDGEIYEESDGDEEDENYNLKMEWKEEELMENESLRKIETCILMSANDVDWKSMKSTFDLYEQTEIWIKNDSTRRFDVVRVDDQGNHLPHGYSAPISSFWGTSAYSGNIFLLKDDKRGTVEFVLKVTEKPTMYIIEGCYEENIDCIDDEKQSSCKHILNNYSDKRIGPRKIGFNTRDIVNDVISELKRSNLKFVDQDFPPRSDCKRAQDLFKKPAIFKKISVKDPIQGCLGDCFLICSVSGAALRPNLLRRVFIASDKALGLYALTFYLEPNNEKMTLLLDDYFPTENGHLKYAHSDDCGELWVSLIEKAIAKIAGGYDKVDPSMNAHLIYPSNILSFLFGGRAKQLEWFTDTDSKAIEMMKNDTFWPLIEKLLDSNSSVPVCGTKGTEVVNSKGLVKFHGYSLLGYRKFPEHNLKLVNLRNTWGRIEYNGPWSDNSSEWYQYPDVKTILQPENRDDGCFWMTYEAFENYFGVIWWNDK